VTRRSHKRWSSIYGPTQLNRPAQEEAAAGAMVKRHPTNPAGHCALATVLLRTARPAEAEKVLHGARAPISATAAARVGMARELMETVRSQKHLSPDVARRLFDEAGALLTEAERLNANDFDVLSARLRWLGLNANRFDPARAAVYREQTQRLLMRMDELRAKKGLPTPR
jgi:hypothetical protein